MRPRITVLLAFSLLEYSIAACAWKTPHPPASVCPKELEHQFNDMDLVSYAQYLGTPDAAISGIAPEDIMLDILKKGAKELKLPQLSVFDERDRGMVILLALQTVTRIHSRQWKGDDCSNSSLMRLAGTLQVKFDAYAKSSCLPWWRGFCMAGLLEEVSLSPALPWLSEDFKENNMEHLLFASLVIEDWDVFTSLAESCDWTVQRHWGCVIVGVAIKGSVSLLRKVQRYLSAAINWPTLLSTSASMFHQEELFAEALQMIQAIDDRMAREKALRTAFVGACSTGVKGMVTLFLKDHLDVLREKDFIKGSVEAAELGNLPMLKYFALAQGKLSLGNDLVLKAALLTAIENHRIQVLVFLLLEWGSDHRAELEPIIPEALDRAIRRASFDAVKLLLGRDNHDNLWIPTLINDEHATSLLHGAIRQRRMDIIALVLDQDDPRFAHFDVAAHHNAAFRLACEVGNVEAVRFLLRVNADQTRTFPDVDPGALSNAGLVSACENGHLDVVKVLLSLDEHGALVYQTVDPGARRNQPLMEATYHGHLAIVEFLLQTRSTSDGTYYVFEDLDLASWYQRALHHAVAGKSSHIIAFLLQKDDNGNPIHPNVHIPDDLLSEAVLRGSWKVVNVLLGRLSFTREELVYAREVAISAHQFHLLGLIDARL